MRQLQDHQHHPVEEEPQRGARLQRLRPLLQATQCENPPNITHARTHRSRGLNAISLCNSSSPLNGLFISSPKGPPAPNHEKGRHTDQEQEALGKVQEEERLNGGLFVAFRAKAFRSLLRDGRVRSGCSGRVAGNVTVLRGHGADVLSVRRSGGDVRDLGLGSRGLDTVAALERGRGLGGCGLGGCIRVAALHSPGRRRVPSVSGHELGDVIRFVAV